MASLVCLVTPPVDERVEHRGSVFTANAYPKFHELVRAEHMLRNAERDQPFEFCHLR